MFLISLSNLPPILNRLLEHLHFEKHLISIAMIKTKRFLYTKKSSTKATASEINAIAASIDGMVKVRYALIPVANVTASSKDPKNSKFSKFLMFWFS